MAAPLHALLVLASLCCISLSHGRILLDREDISTSSRELNSNFNGVSVSEFTPSMTSEVQSSSPGRIVSRIGEIDSDWQYEDLSVSFLQGKKWTRTLGKVAEWVLHTCVVLLAVFAVFYTVICIYACCTGLDLLAEIWRSLGGCAALKALLSYFVNLEQAIVEGDSLRAASG